MQTPTAFSAISVEQVQLNPTPVAITRPLTISVTATNHGHDSGTQSFPITLDGTRIGTVEFSLPAGNQSTKSITVTIPRVGRHELSVGRITRVISTTRYPHHFVERRGHQFVIADNTAYFNGVHVDHHPLLAPHLIDEELEDAANLGANVIAVHAFETGSWITAKFGPRKDERFSFHPEPQTYHEPTFKLLDYLIYKAKRLDLRVILELGNNWGNHGGIPQYVEWSSTAKSHDDFFTDTEANNLYRAYVQNVLTRTNTITGLEYRNDPTIMLWAPIKEIANTSANNRDVVTNWIQETTAFFKRLDPNHLVTPAPGGHYRRENLPESFLKHGFGRAGAGSFVVDHQQPAVDACGFNFYPDYVNYGSGPLSVEEGRQFLEGENDDLWLQQHIQDAHQTIGKPAILREFNDGLILNRGTENQSEMMKVRNQVLASWYRLFDQHDLNGAILYSFAPDALIDFAMELGVPMKNGVQYEDVGSREVIQDYSQRVREKSEYEFEIDV